MGFFRDIISGGGGLYKKVVPKEIRKLVPKEIAPGGFDPARDWFGYDINVDPAKQAAQAQAMKQQQEMDAATQSFNQAGTVPIPGLTGPTSGNDMLPGLLGMAGPRLNQIPGPAQQQPVTHFQPQGPYGQEAMQMAGLLGQSPLAPPVGVPPVNGAPPGIPPVNGQVNPLIPPGQFQRPVMGDGLLGEPTKGFSIPRYRPYGK